MCFLQLSYLTWSVLATTDVTGQVVFRVVPDLNCLMSFSRFLKFTDVRREYPAVVMRGGSSILNAPITIWLLRSMLHNGQQHCCISCSWALSWLPLTSSGIAWTTILVGYWVFVNLLVVSLTAQDLSCITRIWEDRLIDGHWDVSEISSATCAESNVTLNGYDFVFAIFCFICRGHS